MESGYYKPNFQIFEHLIDLTLIFKPLEYAKLLKFEIVKIGQGAKTRDTSDTIHEIWARSNSVLRV